MKCAICNEPKLDNKHTLCMTCSRLGMRNNWKYDESASREESEWYKMYRAVQHHKTIDKSKLDTEATVRYFLENYTPADFEDKYLMKKNNDLPFSTTNYILTPTRLRGLARKQKKPSRSQYIGVAGKMTKQGYMSYWATFKGKYIKDSSSTDESISAAVRDNYIIQRGLQHEYRLNFGDTI